MKAFWKKHVEDVGALFCTGSTLDAYGVRHPALYNGTRGKQRVVTVGVNAAIFNEKIQPLSITRSCKIEDRSQEIRLSHRTEQR